MKSPERPRGDSDDGCAVARIRGCAIERRRAAASPAEPAHACDVNPVATNVGAAEAALPNKKAGASAPARQTSRRIWEEGEEDRARWQGSWCILRRPGRSEESESEEGTAGAEPAKLTHDFSYRGEVARARGMRHQARGVGIATGYSI